MNFWKPYKTIRKNEYGATRLSIILLIFVEIWMLLELLLPQQILQTLIIVFWQHVSIMHNNYYSWLLFFLLRSHHKSISHNLTNWKYGLHILSLIWHLLPCSNALFMTLDVTTFFHLLHEPITLSCYAFFHLFLLYHFLRILLTLYIQPTMFILTCLLVPIWFYFF
jgi:hypothetical protein